MTTTMASSWSALFIVNLDLGQPLLDEDDYGESMECSMTLRMGTCCRDSAGGMTLELSMANNDDIEDGHHPNFHFKNPMCSRNTNTIFFMNLFVEWSSHKKVHIELLECVH